MAADRFLFTNIDIEFNVISYFLHMILVHVFEWNIFNYFSYVLILRRVLYFSLNKFSIFGKTVKICWRFHIIICSLKISYLHFGKRDCSLCSVILRLSVILLGAI